MLIYLHLSMTLAVAFLFAAIFSLFTFAYQCSKDPHSRKSKLCEPLIWGCLFSAFVCGFIGFIFYILHSFL